MPTKQQIEDLYRVMSLRKTATALGLSYTGLQYWISVYQIPKRSRSEAQIKERNHRFGKLGKLSSRFGKRHSEKTKKTLAEKRIGVGNPHWKGGVTTLVNRIRQVREYKAWKTFCLERDKCCQVCFEPKNLEVDHIKPLSLMLSDFGIVSVELAKNCEALWDVSNGITLCHTCHRRKHFKS